MNDTFTELHQTCHDLNQAWMEALQAQSDAPVIDVYKFTKIFTLVKEASKKGTTFLIDYEPSSYLKARVMKTDAEQELFSLPDWQLLTPITNMLKLCDEKNWYQLKPYYDELNKISVRPILHAFVSGYAKKQGPFYTKETNDTIHAFGNFGNTNLDILLITMFYSVDVEV